MKLVDSLKRCAIVWVWNHTPSCAEMSRLTSRSLDQPLTLKLRLKMRLHFLICAWCQRYFDQINFLHQAAPRLGLDFGALSGRGMSAEMKQRVVRQIRAGL